MDRDGIRKGHVQLREHRERLGLTQVETADALAALAWERDRERVGVDAAMVSKWERGTKRPARLYRKLLCAFYGATEERLGLRPEVATPVVSAGNGAPFSSETDEQAEEGGFVQRRDLLRHTAVLGTAGAFAGVVEPWERLAAALEQRGVPGADAVAQLQLRTRELFDLEERVPARRLAAAATQHLEVVTDALHRVGRSALRRQLIVAAGETAALTGWLAFDLGQDDKARACFTVACNAAGQAADAALAACALGYRSYVESKNGDHHLARDLLRKAQTYTSGPPAAGESHLVV